MMVQVNLEDEEWQKVLGILATAPWNVANPLLMKIGEQLRHAPQARVEQGNGREQHPRDDPQRPPAAPGGGGGVEHRAEKQPRR